MTLSFPNKQERDELEITLQFTREDKDEPTTEIPDAVRFPVPRVGDTIHLGNLWEIDAPDHPIENNEADSGGEAAVGEVVDVAYHYNRNTVKTGYSESIDKMEAVVKITYKTPNF